MSQKQSEGQKATYLQFDRLTLRLNIEEKKNEHKQQRRPINRFLLTGVSLIAIPIIMIIISNIWVNGYFIAATVIITIVSVFGLAILLVYFFMPESESGFEGIRRIKELISLREDIENLQTQLQLMEKYQILQHTNQDYYQEISQVIFQYQSKANRYRFINYMLQILVILFSLLVTGLTSGLTNLIDIFNNHWIAPLLSLLVSFLTAMNTLFRPHDRGFSLQQTTDAIEYETRIAKRGIFDYKGLSDEEAYIKLAEKTEQLIHEQRKRQQQLEQASEAKKPSE